MMTPDSGTPSTVGERAGERERLLREFIEEEFRLHTADVMAEGVFNRQQSDPERRAKRIVEYVAALRESEKGERIEGWVDRNDSGFNPTTFTFFPECDFVDVDAPRATLLLHDSEPRSTEGGDDDERERTRDDSSSDVAPEGSDRMSGTASQGLAHQAGKGACVPASTPAGPSAGRTDVGEQEDEYTVEQMVELDRGDDFLPNGEMRCSLCGRVPCRCGVPAHFARAFDQLLARLTATTPSAPAPVSGEPLGEDVRERFWSKVPDRPEHGCWEWASTIHPKGYGHFYCDGRQRYAHRVSFRMAYDHIPTGFQVMHRCDNRKCVRPDHLTVGTNADNVADMVSKRRQNYGEKNPNSVFTEDDVRHIRSSDEASAELAAQYDVAPQTINKIRRGESWSHVGTVSATECRHSFSGEQGWVRALVCRKCHHVAPVDDPPAVSATEGGEALEALDGVGLIARERLRQVETEGWSPSHDDTHTDGILAIAAAELAVDGTDATVENPLDRDHCGSLAKHGEGGSKPDRVRALTIAGALIAAEIDRELRATTRSTGEPR